MVSKKIDKFVKEAHQELLDKQLKLMKKFDFSKQAKFMINADGKFYTYNLKRGKVLMEGNYQIVGTYKEKSDTWRYSWANRYVPCKLSLSTKRLFEFGEEHKEPIFYKPKLKGSHWGINMTSLVCKLAQGKGYHIIKSDGDYPDIYLIFTKVKKSDRNIKYILSQLGKKKTKRKLRLRNIVKKTLKKKN